jgi:myo-inositol 2-dehydrogenase/D-chiro-inositol 1-dehydrogenase
MLMARKEIAVALLGAGRAGQEHAKNLGSLPHVKVALVCDPDTSAAQNAAYSARAEGVTESFDAVFERRDIQAVIISTPTETHTGLIKIAAEAGKAIFCEKPVSLDLAPAIDALNLVKRTGVPFQIGFDRRYDPGYSEVKRKIDAGVLGQIDQFISVSRDPAPPSKAYLARSGGLLIDSAIHDFDLARFLVGEVEGVLAWGTVRFSRDAEAVGDIDTATTFLRFRSGAQGVIQNCRRAAYGYDVMTEISGEHGKLVVNAESKTPTYHFRKGGWERDYFYFFMDRFGAAFREELIAFFDALLRQRDVSPDGVDALEALRIGIAATQSLRENRAVKLAEVAG